MKNLVLFLILFLSLKGNLLGQNVNDVIKNPVTEEYFLKPLKEELKKEYPFSKPKITEELIQDALNRAAKDCAGCFEIKDETNHTSVTIEQQKSLAANNPYQINFKDYISVDGFTSRTYLAYYISRKSRPAIYDFKSFRDFESLRLKELGIKKKSSQEALFNTLVTKREELGKKLAEFYAEYDHTFDLFKKFGERYSELYERSDYPSDELKKLVAEKISPHFNSLDNILIYPQLTSKVNTEKENEKLKKMLLDKSLVEINEGQKPGDDGLTFILPEIGKNLEKRADTLIRYFNLKYRNKAQWKYSKQRILKLWYGNLGNEFTLQNFLKALGSNVPSKEDFLANEDELKELIKVYVDDLLNGRRVGGGFTGRDNELNMYPKDILFHNILKNHYAIDSDNLKQLRKEQGELKEKEQSEKGGFLRSKVLYKVNSQGKFDKLHFWSNLSIERKINQSDYWGKYEKKSGNIYKVTLEDLKTGIELPEFEARLSSDKTKLYFGEDKVPYILDGSNGTNCLKDKKTTWYSFDNKESFSTSYAGVTWESSITGGIEAEGSLYKISDNKYAFVIYKNSWGGKIDNNLVIITTANNCNTIYYGKGGKKMVVK